MKILYFNYMNDLYGSSIGSTLKIVKLFERLRYNGFQVKMVWRHEAKGREEGETTEPPFFKIALRALFFTPKELFNNLRDYFQERAIIRQECPDIIIVRLDLFRLSSAYLAKKYRIPLLIEADGAMSYEWLTFHKGPHLWPKTVKACEKWVLEKADGIFTQSKVALDYYVNTHALDPKKFKIITNGADWVDLPEQHAVLKTRTQLGIDSRARVIGFVGSMHHWHGLVPMKESILALMQYDEQLVFLFVGSGGAEAKQFMDYFEPRHRKRIYFIEHVEHDQVKHYISLFDIAIAPYPKIDVFYFSPVKIFEYMSLAKPVVAPDLGQISDIIDHAQNGMLYSAGDWDAFKRNILVLLNDPELARQIGAAARETVYRSFTWSDKAKELGDFITTLRNNHQWEKLKFCN
ncbi:glycosyltransferase [candidate division KSB1 bacterium]|nr:glycosyltransferase [candidate division KSB1 bacterium]